MATFAGSKGANPPRPVTQEALGAGSKGQSPPRPTDKIVTRK